jgi:16S rRNA (guanine966-N2)-methyltransferase
MRIVGGLHKGRNIISPPGLATRPTSDRARESIYNILYHANWLEHDILTDAAVMDVFAGTGALGLEALSRGASHAVFIEQDRAALTACRANVAAMSFAAQAIVLAQSALKPSSRPAAVAPRTLVFLDPPYIKKAGDAGLGAQAVAALEKSGWIAEDAVLVMEMAKKLPEAVPAGYTVMDTRDYGVARVVFLKKNGV